MVREYGPSNIIEMQKSQALRLWDVFVLGPFMLHLARKKQLTDLEAKVLMTFGVLTILYNSRNYFQNVCPRKGYKNDGASKRYRSLNN